MDRTQALILTLIAYQLAMLGIGLWAVRRNRDTEDFFLGGRRLGPLVAAISTSASSSSAWTLLGVSGTAFALGLPAIWLLPATVGGFLLNWYVVAPRLQRVARDTGVLTLSELVAGDPMDPRFSRNIRLCSLIILFSFLFYVASQFQAAGQAFANSFELSAQTSLLIGASIVLAYTLLGGFWAVSITDTMQGLLMALSAVVIPIVALFAVGGPAALWAQIMVAGSPGATLTGDFVGIMGIFFVLGTLGIGLGYPGQPHVVNRYMAIRSAEDVPSARRIAVGWALVVYPGMLILGWCGRVLFPEIADPEQVFFEVTNQLLPAIVSGVMIAAILSAIMSTADSQLLVATSSLSYDWDLAKRGRQASLIIARLAVVVLCAAAVLLALYAPQTIFARVLFAFHALGSAFGPVLLLRISGRQINSNAIFASMMAGVGLTVFFYWLPNTPGDVAERLLPFAAAFILAWRGTMSPDKKTAPASIEFPEDRDYT